MAGPRRASPVDPTLLGLLAITVGALVLRLIDLGGRIAHWDEGRVAHDTIRYHKSGIWEFHPVVHGPFLPKVNNHVFTLLGADDVSMRLVVALIGGLAPLAAWLLREHLRREELVGLGLLLAANPVLLYYSRFMRNDAILAVVMLVAFGLFVRAIDTEDVRYLYPAVLAVALGFTMKANAVLYLVTWLVTLGVVLDHRALFGPRNGADVRPLTTIKAEGRRAARGLWAWRGHVLTSILLGLGVIVVFYLPKGPNAITLVVVITAPWRLPELLEVGLIEPTRMTIDHWVTGPNTETPYLSFLVHYLTTLGAGAIVVSLFAAAGFVADRYRPSGPRSIVTIATLWGVFSVLGYPIVADIRAPWLVAHAVVPLAIPAAVGLGAFYRSAREMYDAEDWIGVGAAVVVTILVVAAVAQPALTLVYLSPTAEDNQLVQFAQPGGAWGETIDDIQELAAANDGVDVYYAGPTFFMRNESDADTKPASGGWYDRLPLPWYEEQVDAVTASGTGPNAIRETIDTDRPPVVIVAADDEDRLPDDMNGYDRRRTHLLRVNTFEVVVYLDTDR